MKFSPIRILLLAICSLTLPACETQNQEHHQEVHKITATTPVSQPVTITEHFVCQIHSRRHIHVRALERGYLEEIPIQEGQTVKEGELMFSVIPVIYRAKLNAVRAAARSAELELNYSKKLLQDKVVSENDVALFKAKVLKADAEVKRAEAELDFASIKAPFDGVVDRMLCQQGSLVEKGDKLTTLSDNSTMWVYFNVPESQYLGFMSELKQKTDELKIELLLADNNKFSQPGKLGAIEAEFDNSSGNIPFRADFPNPDRLLRNGQTGTILISRVINDALVIPQRASFEYLNKRYVYVLDKDDIAHRREITISHEMEDVFLVKSGLDANDKFILEGTRQVHDGEKVTYVDVASSEVAGKLKYHAE